MIYSHFIILNYLLDKIMENNENTKLLIIFQHGIISFIGIIGNLLVLLVYTKKLYDKSTITFFICHLAFTDLICCTFLIPINCYHELNIDRISSDFMCKFHSFLNILNVTYSCLLMVLVASERLFSIKYPVKKFFTRQIAKQFMSCSFLFCLIVAVSGALGVGTSHLVLEYSNNNNNTNIILNRTMENKLYSDKELPITNNISAYWYDTQNCFPNNEIISRTYLKYVITFQNSTVVLCFVVIFIFYAFILHFVLEKRKHKMKRDRYYKKILNQSKLFTRKSQQETPVDMNEEEFLPQEFNSNRPNSIALDILDSNKKRNFSIMNSELITNETSKIETPAIEKSILSKTVIASLKTAFMLFVATFIMILVYTPAILTSFEIISYNAYYWNILYINNASNPLVYSFLNSKFRKAFKSLFLNHSRSFSVSNKQRSMSNVN